MTTIEANRAQPVVRSGHVQLSIILRDTEKATLQTQIFDQIRTMILNGQLRGDDPLPTTRELSAQLGVSRNTAVLAYERLISEGYIRTKPYVGTFVSPDLPDTAFLSSALEEEPAEQPAADHEAGIEPPPLRTHQLADPNRRRLAADFWVGRPDARMFPLKAWSQHIKGRLKSAGVKLTTYSDPAGLLELRQAIAKHLAPARGGLFVDCTVGAGGHARAVADLAAACGRSLAGFLGDRTHAFRQALGGPLGAA